MNGVSPEVEIFAPFGEAFGLTKKILFQPFDPKKWFVIGFAAFLSNLLSGGGGLNPGLPDTDRLGTRELSSTTRAVVSGSQALEPWLIALLGAVFVIVFGLIVLCWWLGSRGQFIFTDCVVRNRAAIQAPWREFKREGNSYFFFILVTAAVFLGIAAILALPVVLPFIWRKPPDFAFWATLIFLIGVFFFFCIAFGLVTQFMVPLMYRRRCAAWEAVRENIALVRAFPGPIILYTMFIIVLFMAVAIIGCVATCLTCCIAAIPYIGTVILLPLHVFLRAFKLLFLRQWGPDYDVWAGVTQPEAPPAPPSAPVSPTLPA